MNLSKIQGFSNLAAGCHHLKIFEEKKYADVFFVPNPVSDLIDLAFTCATGF